MLRRLYEDDSMKDITFKLASGTTFRAHRCILKVSSVEWFQVILASEFKDASSEVVEIGDCSDKVFEIALLWAYEIFDNNSSVEDCFLAADKFLAPSLIQHYSARVVGININKYVDFLIGVMKYPLAFRDTLQNLHAMDLYNLRRVLGEAKYRDRAESIILFMLKDCTLTKCTAESSLNYWLSMAIYNDDVAFGKPVLDMREITIILLNKGMFIRPAALHEETFKSMCKLLIEKGYYRQEEVDKLYKEESRPYLVISSYPLKIGKLIRIDKALRAHEKVLFMYDNHNRRKIKTYLPEFGVDDYYNVIEI